VAVANTGLELQAFKLSLPKKRTAKVASAPQQKSVVFESSDLEMESIENGEFNILFLDGTNTELWARTS